MFRFISLFTGIGGFDLGFEQAGMECALQVERDKKALDLLRRQWPEVPKLEDVRDVTKDNAPSTELVCGGFPCQDVSVAGRREGLAGERSGLWFEFLRIIKDLRPKWVVIENVPGLLSSNGGRDMGTVIGGLAKCGYWWSYRVLDAQYYGVPQRRRRVFIVASLTAGLAQEVLFERESSPWDTAPSRETGAAFAAAITERTREAGRTLEMSEDLAYALTNPGSGGRPHSRLIAFASQAGGNTGLNINDDLSGTLQENQQMAIAFGGNNTQGPVSVATACNAHGSRRYDFESETFILSSNYGQYEEGQLPVLRATGGAAGPGSEAIITNTFNGYTGGVDDNDAQGNHLVIEFDASRGQYTGDIAAPLRVNGARKPGVNDGKPDNMCISGQMGVRRLTPLECERLQGFPDNFTAGQSDSARYRQLGKAVAVPAVRWLGKRIRGVVNDHTN